MPMLSYAYAAALTGGGGECNDRLKKNPLWDWYHVMDHYLNIFTNSLKS